MNVPLLVPNINSDDENAVLDVLRSGWITQGPQVASFEKEFADFTGTKYACAVSSATTALHLALMAVGVQPGDEVITVSHSFIATANAIRYCGAVPVFMDIDLATYNIDHSRLEEAIGPKTKAILAVHQMGMPCDIKAIIEIAARYNLPVVEDAACALGSKVFFDKEFQAIGAPHGDIACFSFHPRKVLTTGDGGMLTTNNEEYDEKFRLLRQHGMSVSDRMRHSSDKIIFEQYSVVGYNYRLTDLQAALGRSQLRRLEWLIEERQRLASLYKEALSDCKNITLPHEPEYARTNWQSYCIRLGRGLDQKSIMQKMLDAGISTRRGIMNAHREPAYTSGVWKCGHCKSTAGNCGCLHNSEIAQDECILIPLFPGMTVEQMEYTATTLRKLVE